MGDIAFNIAKDVNLNKTVNLNIDKNVDVNVNIDDLLATAEADAEAFGTFALAEVDAYTFVNEGEEGGTSIETIIEPGEVDVLGNSTDFILSGGTTDIPDAVDIDGAVSNNITIDFTGPGDGTVPPDVDDINGFGKLEPLTSPPPDTADAPIPDPLLSISDLNLLLVDGTITGTPEGDVAAEYELTEDVVIDFGTRTLDIDGSVPPTPDTLAPTTAELLLTIPAGTDFLVEYLGPTEPSPSEPPLGPIELEFEAFDEGNPGFFTFAGEDYTVDNFVMTAGSLQDTDIADLSDYAFEAIAEFPMSMLEIIPGTGEAFAYAESTSAVDLGGGEVTPPIPEPEG